MKKLSIILITIVIVVSLCIVGCARAPGAPEQKTIRMGINLALSGPAAPWGIPMDQGTRLEIDKVNSEGGIEIGGDKYLIEVFVEDSELSTEKAVSKARKLINEHDVHMIWGGQYTSQSIALAIVCTPAKVISCGPNWTKEVLSTEVNHLYYLKGMASSHEIQPAMFTYTFSAYPGIEKVAIISDTTDSSRYSGGLAWQYLEAIGKEVTGAEYYEPGTEDLRPYLTRMLAQEPDFIFTTAVMPTGLALIVKQAREMGFDGPFQFDLCLTPDFLDIAGPENAEGLITTEMVTSGPESTPGMNDFVDRYTKKYGEFDPVAAYNIPVFWSLLEAYQIAGTVEDADAVMRVMETTGLDVYGLEARFGDGGGFYDLPHQMAFPMYILEVIGGENKIVDFVSAEKQLAPWPCSAEWPWEPK